MAEERPVGQRRERACSESASIANVDRPREIADTSGERRDGHDRGDDGHRDEPTQEIGVDGLSVASVQPRVDEGGDDDRGCESEEGAASRETDCRDERDDRECDRRRPRPWRVRSRGSSEPQRTSEQDREKTAETIRVDGSKRGSRERIAEREETGDGDRAEQDSPVVDIAKRSADREVDNEHLDREGEAEVTPCSPKAATYVLCAWSAEAKVASARAPTKTL